VAYAFACFDELFTGRLLGKEPRATREAVKMGRKKMFASSEKAVRELGYKVTPIESALQRAVDWFRSNQYV
jgi:dihydroflavonol-4-reductase